MARDNSEYRDCGGEYGGDVYGGAEVAERGFGREKAYGDEGVNFDGSGESDGGGSECGGLYSDVYVADAFCDADGVVAFEIMGKQEGQLEIVGRDRADGVRRGVDAILLFIFPRAGMGSDGGEIWEGEKVERVRIIYRGVGDGRSGVFGDLAVVDSAYVFRVSWARGDWEFAKCIRAFNGDMEVYRSTRL